MRRLSSLSIRLGASPRSIPTSMPALLSEIAAPRPQRTTQTNIVHRHMGRCIYGGIYDPGNPRSDTHGYRTDVLSALRELDIPVIRYPGGNFVATYHWQDGIGPKENRPARPELAWLGTETNEFGEKL